MWLRLIIYFLLACPAIGSMAVIVTRSYVFKALRWELLFRCNLLGRLLCCPLCFSTWLSLFTTTAMAFAGNLPIMNGLPKTIGFIIIFLGVWFSTLTFSAPFSALAFHAFWSMPTKEIEAYEKFMKSLQ